MKRRGSKKKRKKRRTTKQKLYKCIHIEYYEDYLMEFTNIKALGLNSKKRMK